MSEETLRGTISFVNYEKHFATIDYLKNTKQKSVNCKTDVADEGKKKRRFRIGDEVSFQLKLSDRGDKMTAHKVKFLYNTSLEVLINKAATENRFTGYLKEVDDELFVKERDSYHFFPLKLSKWEHPPAEEAFNEAISFRLIHLDKPNAIAAELFSHNFIPEYREALQCQKEKKVIEATVARISPYAAYLNLFSGKIQAKLPLKDDVGTTKEGDKLSVRITYLNANRIAVEKVE